MPQNRQALFLSFWSICALFAGKSGALIIANKGRRYFTSLTNMQPLLGFPGPIITIDYFLQDPFLLMLAQAPWLLSLLFLVLSLPLSVATHSAAGCFCALLIPTIFFAWFGFYIRNNGPASRSYYMLQDEARMILAIVQGDGGGETCHTGTRADAGDG